MSKFFLGCIAFTVVWVCFIFGVVVGAHNGYKVGLADAPIIAAQENQERVLNLCGRGFWSNIHEGIDQGCLAHLNDEATE